MQDADNHGLDSSASDSHLTLFLNATTTVHFFKIDKAGYPVFGLGWLSFCLAIGDKGRCKFRR